MPVVREAFPRTVRLVSQRAAPRVRPEGAGRRRRPRCAWRRSRGATSRAALQAEHRRESVTHRRRANWSTACRMPNASSTRASPTRSRETSIASTGRAGARGTPRSRSGPAWSRSPSTWRSSSAGRAASRRRSSTPSSMPASPASIWIFGRRPAIGALDPDPAVGYPAGNALADDRARPRAERDHLSVRPACGGHLPCRRSGRTRSSPWRWATLYRLVWNGAPPPAVSRIQG